MERVACSQSLLLCFSNSSIKVLLINRNFTLFSKAIAKEHPPHSPKQGPYGNRHPFSEPYLAYPSGSPVMEPSLQVPLIELPWREIPCFQSPQSFIFQPPVYMPPSRFPSRAPMEREMPVSRAFLYITFMVPSSKWPDLVHRWAIPPGPKLKKVQFAPPQIWAHLGSVAHF